MGVESGKWSIYLETEVGTGEHWQSFSNSIRIRGRAYEKSEESLNLGIEGQGKWESQ